jgi:hypothetical protein
VPVFGRLFFAWPVAVIMSFTWQEGSNPALTINTLSLHKIKKGASFRNMIMIRKMHLAGGYQHALAQRADCFWIKVAPGKSVR